MNFHYHSGISAMCVSLIVCAVIADEPILGQSKRPELVSQIGHSTSISSVFFSHDGKTILTGGDGKTARLWDVHTGKLLRSFSEHTSAIHAVRFTPDSKIVMTVDGDKSVRMWDTKTGKAIRKFEVSDRGNMLGAIQTVQILVAAFSPDGKRLLIGDSQDTAYLWDIEAGKLLHVFSGHKAPIRAMAFSSDSNRILTYSNDKSVRLWDVRTGNHLRSFVGHSGAYHSIAFSPDGSQILINGSTEALLFDAMTGKEKQSLVGHGDSICAVAFSPDGKQIATDSNDKTVRLWDAQTGKVIRIFAGYEDLLPSVRPLAFSPDGKYLLTSGENFDLRLWDIQSGKELRDYKGKANIVFAVAISPDSKRVVTSGLRQDCLWNTETGESLSLSKKYSYRSAVAFSPDGKTILTGGEDKTARLYDSRTGNEIRTFAGHTDRINAVAFSYDGTSILTCSSDNTTRFWDVRTGKVIRVYQVQSMVTSLALSRDGTQFLTGGSDKTARLWDVRTGMENRSFVRASNSSIVDVPPRYLGWDHLLFPVVFSPNGERVLTGGRNERVVVGGRGKTALLWDTSTGKELREFSHNDQVNALAFSPDGRHVLTGSADKTARIWDLHNGKCVILAGHKEAIFAVAFTPDGKRVLTGSEDCTTRIWDAQSGRQLCTLLSFEQNSWAVVDPAGRFDASNGGDVDGLHWVVGNEPIALKQLKERYYDPGLLAKVMGFNKEPLRDVAVLDKVNLHPDVKVATIKPTDKSLTLDVTNRGGGIGRVQVFVNGKEVVADARPTTTDATAKSAQLTVDLTGAPIIAGKPNQVEVVTWNTEGYLSGRSGLIPDWTPEGKADAHPPELYVIACGVSAYADPKLNLRYAAKDAEDMARALALAGKRLFGADKVHLTLLTTSENATAQKPSKENIRKAFESVRQAKPTDIFVVYLAGHGVALKQGGDEYCYLTTAARGTDATVLADPAVLQSWAVTSSELVDWIKKIPALKQVMLLDTCAAGAAAGKLLDHRDLSGDQVRALDRLKDRTGFHVLMGCAADRVSYEASQYSQGLLTYSLLQGMAGAKLREGEYVDVSSLFQYAADEVPNLARGIGGVQKPMVMAPRGTSFDIGRLIAADRNALPIARPKPLILRPLLSNAEDGDDNLKLTTLVRQRLTDDSFSTTRGVLPATVFVDADELAGGIRPAGQYTVVGTKITIRLVLKRDDKTMSVVPITGSTDNLTAFAEQIVTAITAGTKTK